MVFSQKCVALSTYSSKQCEHMIGRMIVRVKIRVMIVFNVPKTYQIYAIVLEISYNVIL